MEIIYNEFNKWSKNNVFKEAFYKHINLFIDETNIANSLGSEGITINGEYKKKNVTHITVICYQNKLPLSTSCLKINKTSTHKIKNVQNTLDNIDLIIKDYVDLNLIGDHGYISKEKFKIMEKDVNIITPKRKNQHTQNTDKKNI